jgi:hypothetical protein
MTEMERMVERMIIIKDNVAWKTMDITHLSANWTVAGVRG